MGINAIGCKGSYSEVKESTSASGDGFRGASDFDGADMLMTGLVAATAVAGGALLALELAGKGEEAPKGPTESAKIEYGPFQFNASGENKTVHSQYSNKTYQIELEKIETSSYMTLIPVITDKVVITVPITHYNHAGHFNITDTETMEKTQVTLVNSDSADIAGNVGVHARVGGGMAELTMTETYTIPLKE